jgi:hypothetical protein
MSTRECDSCLSFFEKISNAFLFTLCVSGLLIILCVGCSIGFGVTLSHATDYWNDALCQRKDLSNITINKQEIPCDCKYINGIYKCDLCVHETYVFNVWIYFDDLYPGKQPFIKKFSYCSSQNVDDLPNSCIQKYRSFGKLKSIYNFFETMEYHECSYKSLSSFSTIVKDLKWYYFIKHTHRKLRMILICCFVVPFVPFVLYGICVAASFAVSVAVNFFARCLHFLKRKFIKMYNNLKSCSCFCKNQKYQHLQVEEEEEIFDLQIQD